MGHRRLPILCRRDLYLSTTFDNLFRYLRSKGLRIVYQVNPRISLLMGDRYVLIEPLARVLRCPKSRSSWNVERGECAEALSSLPYLSVDTHCFLLISYMGSDESRTIVKYILSVRGWEA